MGKRTRDKKQRRSRLESLSEDEIDRFNDSGLKLIDAHGNSHPSGSDDERASDAADDREVVFGDLSSSSESEDEDPALQEDYEAEKEVARVGKKWGKRSADFFKSGEASDEDGDEEEVESGEEEAARREEEEEAVRIKKSQLKSLRDEDFDIGAIPAARAGRGKAAEAEAEAEAVTVRMKAGGKSRGGLERVAEEAPEVLGLVAELGRNVDVLKKQISPVLEAFAGRKEGLTAHGNSYLEAKFHVLLSYCINITFYLLMKANGQGVKDHPVVEELVRLRTTMEKIRPLDAKLRPQLQRLIQKATSSSKPGDSHEAVENEESIAHRPDAEDLVDDEEEEEEEEDEEEQQIKEKKSRSGKYSIPKLSAVHFEEDSSRKSREQRKEARRAARAKKSQFLSDLREEFSERPMEQSAIGTEAKHSSAREEEEDRRRFEEANFMRLRETKEQRVARRKRVRKAEEGMAQSLAEFEDFEGLGMDRAGERDGADDRMTDEADRAEALRRFMRKVESSSNNRKERGKKGKRSGDEIMKRKDPMLLEVMKAGKFEGDGERVKDTAASSKKDVKVDSDEEDDFYQQVKKMRRKRKRDREEMYKVERPAMHEPSLMVEDGDLRGATYKILKNRGLTAHKKKEDKNPRVKMRKKYEKKMKARKGQVRAMREAEDVNYLGEASGLRSNLVRSRKIGKTK